MRFAFLEPASHELAEAVVYLDRERSRLGTEFRKEVLATVKRVLEMPESYEFLGDDFRRARTCRFKCGLVCSTEGDTIIFHAVVHLHRRPGYWRDRE